MNHLKSTGCRLRLQWNSGYCLDETICVRLPLGNNSIIIRMKCAPLPELRTFPHFSRHSGNPCWWKNSQSQNPPSTCWACDEIVRDTGGIFLHFDKEMTPKGMLGCWEEYRWQVAFTTVCYSREMVIFNYSCSTWEVGGHSTWFMKVRSILVPFCKWSEALNIDIRTWVLATFGGSTGSKFTLFSNISDNGVKAPLMGGIGLRADVMQVPVKKEPYSLFSTDTLTDRKYTFSLDYKY